MPPFYDVWLWFKNNETAQWIAGALSLAFLYKLYERARDNRIRSQVEQKIEIKAQETAREVIQEAKEKTHDVIEKADEARAAIPRGTPSGELPKSTQDILFDD